MIRACLGLLAGMYALQLSSFTPASDYLAVPLVAVIGLLILRCAGFLLWFAVGAILFFAAAHQAIDARLPRALEGDSIVVEVTIADFPKRRADGSSFIAHTAADARIPRRIRLSWYQPPVAVHFGDRWRLEVRLRRPRGSRNPGGFDYEAWMFRQHFAAVGYVVPGRRNTLLSPERPGLVDSLRARFVERVAELGLNAPSAAVLMALVVGTRHRLSDAQWERYARTGTSHLMAISGLHVGLAAAGSYYLVLLLAGTLRLARNTHRFAVLCSLLVASAYAQLAGFALPAARASLMLLLLCLVLLRRRAPALADITCCACMALAAFDPLATMSPGFLLSFAAVAVLIWLGQRRGGRLLAAQLLLFFGLLPFSVLLFDRIALAAIPVNLLAVPLFSFLIVPLALTGFVMDGIFEPIGGLLLSAAAQSIAAVEQGLLRVAGADWAALHLPEVAGRAWLFLLLPVAWVCLPRGWPGRQIAWLGLFATLGYESRPPDRACVSIDVLDVGQGLAVVVRTASRVLLYDTGPAYRNGSSAAKRVIVPFLRSRSVAGIDQLIVSHDDLDHAGGVHDVRQALPVHQFRAGEPTVVRATPCRAGQSWHADGIGFRFLGPPIYSTLQGNDASCVLLVEAGDRRILLSGDIERAAEHWLVEQRRLPSVDVVVVPHHGSRTSSSLPFVQALRPQFAIVSAAFGNQWGFPRQDVVDRWQAAGARVLNTATSGAVAMQLCADRELEYPGQYRRDKRRIWHE